jgi:hypothetical protein
MNDTITLGSILGSTLTTVAVLYGIYINGRKVRRETEADLDARDAKLENTTRERSEELKAEIRLHNDSVEKRLGSLEAKSIDFMPRAEIEGKIEHERRNRIAAQDSTVQALNRHSDKITGLEVCVGKVEQKQDGMAADMTELKTLLRDLSRDLNAKLDKQAECLNSLSRKVA